MPTKSSSKHVLMEKFIIAIYISSSRWERRQISSSEATPLSPCGMQMWCTHGLNPPEEFTVKLGKEAQISTTVMKQRQAVYH